jgi:hypothetical protein
VTRWEQLEEFLWDADALGQSFNSAAVAEALDVSRQEASLLIQGYLVAQTRPKARTLFVLTRKGRTSGAMWHVGARTTDVRQLGHQTADDFKTRLLRFVNPTLRRIGEKNPRALPLAQAVIKNMEANIEMLAAMMVYDREGV